MTASGDALNPTEHKIFDIIRADVCLSCNATARECDAHAPRCHAGYRRQAKAIYEQVVSAPKSTPYPRVPTQTEVDALLRGDAGQEAPQDHIHNLHEVPIELLVREITRRLPGSEVVLR